MAETISSSTVRRWLAEDAIKPWRHQSWIFIWDPDFRLKASRVVDLYARSWDGVPLSGRGYVISCDEKIFIQARCHPRLPRARPAGYESTTGDRLDSGLPGASGWITGTTATAIYQAGFWPSRPWSAAPGRTAHLAHAPRAARREQVWNLSSKQVYGES